MSKGKIVALVAGAVILVVAAFFGVRALGPKAPAPAPVPTPAPTPVATPTPSPFAGVSLAESDDPVRKTAAGLTENPAWARWLAHDDLVRRFVASVNLVAKGRSPRSQVPFLRPKKRFTVIERDGKLYADPESWGRYDTVVAVLTSIQPEDAVRVLRQLEPLLDEAYREISRPGTRFDDLLVRAIDHLLATPVPEGDPVLEQKVVTYRYADPDLESLSDAQRQLLRLGPENAARVKEWLQRFQIALEATASPASEPATGPSPAPAG